MDRVHDEWAGVEPITGLCRFRDDFYSCLGARADAQFELRDGAGDRVHYRYAAWSIVPGVPNPGRAPKNVYLREAPPTRWPTATA